MRSLAQRSAAAAREIKTLIDNSVACVATGHAQADAAGATMAQVVQSVQQAAALIAQIGEAEAAQRRQIEQVDRALARIDAMTRQNGTLVRQASAGADALHGEALQLRQAVSRFRLEHGDAEAATEAEAEAGNAAAPHDGHWPTVAQAHEWSANKPSLVSRKRLQG